MSGSGGEAIGSLRNVESQGLRLTLFIWIIDFALGVGIVELYLIAIARPNIPPAGRLLKRQFLGELILVPEGDVSRPLCRAVPDFVHQNASAGLSCSREYATQRESSRELHDGWRELSNGREGA